VILTGHAVEHLLTKNNPAVTSRRGDGENGVATQFYRFLSRGCHVDQPFIRLQGRCMGPRLHRGQASLHQLHACTS
jgi:hypothetical protein